MYLSYMYMYNYYGLRDVLRSIRHTHQTSQIVNKLQLYTHNNIHTLHVLHEHVHPIHMHIHVHVHVHVQLLYKTHNKILSLPPHFLIDATMIATMLRFGSVPYSSVRTQCRLNHTYNIQQCTLNHSL